MSLIESTRPLYALTEGEFFMHMEEFIKTTIQVVIRDKSTSGSDSSANKRYLYGIIGLERALGVSHKTAQKLKDGVLAPAVKQRGRKIVVDLDLTLQLFDEKNGKK